MWAIAGALEAKDEYVYGHERCVSGFASAVGRRLGLDEAKFLDGGALACLLKPFRFEEVEELVGR